MAPNHVRHVLRGATIVVAHKTATHARLAMFSQITIAAVLPNTLLWQAGKKAASPVLQNVTIAAIPPIAILVQLARL
jgi:hypothetical protein